MENQPSSCDRGKSPVWRGRLSTWPYHFGQSDLELVISLSKTVNEKLGQNPWCSDLSSPEPPNGPEHWPRGPQGGAGRALGDPVPAAQQLCPHLSQVFVLLIYPAFEEGRWQVKKSSWKNHCTR